MDLYTLDDTFKPSGLIDISQSLIWTERYKEAGEVSLSVASTLKNKVMVTEGIFLTIPESREVVLIDTVEDKDGSITATGKMLPDFLRTRILRDTWDPAKDHWQLSGTIGEICRTIVQQMCMPGGKMAGGLVLPDVDGINAIIDNLIIGSVADGPTKDVAVQYGNVYDGIKSVVDLDGGGFTLYPVQISGGGYHLVFDTYKGLKRTSDQTTNQVVIFDPALDSLSSVDELRSRAGYATAAYAFGAGMTAQSQMGIAYAPATSTLTNFNRRNILVDASDVNLADYTEAKYTSILNQRAANALANNNYVRMTDGELVPQKNLTYGFDYGMGDIIELRGASGSSQHARVIEYIRVQDETGERSYPTLSVMS